MGEPLDESAPSGYERPVEPPERTERSVPQWLPRAVLIFWAGWIGSLVFRWSFSRLSGLLMLLLVSLFLSLAIEPGVNRLAQRGWKRGRATALILLAMMAAAGLFVGAIGTLVGGQIADLLQNTRQYVNRIVSFANDNFGTQIDPAAVIADIEAEDGAFQKFIASQRDDALRVSANVVGGLFDAFSVLLFTFYLVADGPKLRRVICSWLRPSRQVTVLKTWELAIDKTGSYLYSRALLAGLATVFHWVAFSVLGVPAPIALALWVGIVSQFIPVVGTYIAGVLPVLVTLLSPDTSPIRGLLAFGFILVYQQIENYWFAPKITARTLSLHPAIAFGSALAGAALLGPVGAILALPGSAMVQAVLAEAGGRFRVVSSPLTRLEPRQRVRRRGRRKRSGDESTGQPPT